jgi:hypothetical protein
MFVEINNLCEYLLFNLLLNLTKSYLTLSYIINFYIMYVTISNQSYSLITPTENYFQESTNQLYLIKQKRSATLMGKKLPDLKNFQY